jgi:siroheme decarboxylase
VARRDDLARRLIDRYQREMPLEPRPFAAMAQATQSTEAEVLELLGASTLAAMAVPEERLAAVAELVSACPEVNHNYEREHRLNLWFVVTASDRRRVDAVLRTIEQRTGIAVVDLPLERPYRIDLGFGVSWS